MSNYDIEMVKKFANLNRELIDKTAKDHPEIGGLIKQIIESIKEQEVAPEEKPYIPLSADGARWVKISDVEKQQSRILKSFNLNERANALNLLIESSAYMGGLFVLGDFYELQNEPENRKRYNYLYKPLKEDETSVKFVIKDNFSKYFDIQEVYLTVPNDLVFDTVTMKMFLVDLDFSSLNEVKRQKLFNNLTNELIYDFLLNEGADGFFTQQEKTWFKSNNVMVDNIVLEDYFGRKSPYLFEKLYREIGSSLEPARKPKFTVGDKVMAIESSQYSDKGTGKILETLYNTVGKIYTYDVEFSNYVVNLKESELETPTAQTPKKITPKKTINPTPSPAEIEFSNMTQEQLRIEKEGIEEALSYLNEEDDEKNDLEIQLELLNLYLEN
jgi:hypothetical protein